MNKFLQFIKTYPQYLLFLFVLILGLSIVKDFGMPYDETAQNKILITNAFQINKDLNYLFVSKDKIDNLSKLTLNWKITDIDQFNDRDYGVINEVFVSIPAFIFASPSQFLKYFTVRHIMVFLIFWIAAIFFYKTIDIIYKNKLLSCIGYIFLMLSPRIFADAFYNSKDLVFLSFFIIAFYFSIKLIFNFNKKNAIIAGLFCGMLVATRILGIVLPVILVSLISFDKLVLNRKSFGKKDLYSIIALILSAGVFTIVFWPYLWTNPIGNFVSAFHNMSKFNRGPEEVWYFGKIFQSNNLPWHYIFVQIGLTTPLLYIILFLAAIASFIYSQIKSKSLFWRDNQGLNQYLEISLFFAPIAAIIILNSVLYNGWRQVYFLYPFFLLIAIMGLNKFFEYVKEKHSIRGIAIALSIIAIASLNIAYSMIRLHPYEMIYYNSLAPSYINDKFEVDYWGLSYRKGLDFLSRITPQDKNIKIFSGERKYISSSRDSKRMIKNEDINRIIFYTSLDSADYYVTNFDDSFLSKKNIMKRYNILPEDEIFAINFPNASVLSVFKLNHHNKIDSSLNDSLRSFRTLKRHPELIYED